MMGRLVRVGMAGLFAAAMFGGVGCKWLKGGDVEEEKGSASATASAAPAPPPGPATVAQDPVPGASGAPSAAASAAPVADSPEPPADTGAPMAPPPHGKEPVAPVRGQSIDACCSALAAYKFSGRPAGVRNKAVRAAGVCRGIADTVRSGRSTRAAGLAQVRALAGGAAPPECN